MSDETTRQIDEADLTALRSQLQTARGLLERVKESARNRFPLDDMLDDELLDDVDAFLASPSRNTIADGVITAEDARAIDGAFASPSRPPESAGPAPDVLKTLTPEQLATFKPLTDEAIAEALAKGQHDRRLAMGTLCYCESCVKPAAPPPTTPVATKGEVCPTCKGRGQREQRMDAFNPAGNPRPCYDCGGTGHLPAGEP